MGIGVSKKTRVPLWVSRITDHYVRGVDEETSNSGNSRVEGVVL